MSTLPIYPCQSLPLPPMTLLIRACHSLDWSSVSLRETLYLRVYFTSVSVSSQRLLWASSASSCPFREKTLVRRLIPWAACDCHLQIVCVTGSGVSALFSCVCVCVCGFSWMLLVNSTVWLPAVKHLMGVKWDSGSGFLILFGHFTLLSEMEE